MFTFRYLKFSLAARKDVSKYVLSFQHKLERTASMSLPCMVIKKLSYVTPVIRHNSSSVNINRFSSSLMHCRKLSLNNTRKLLYDNAKTVYVGGSNFDDYSEHYLKDLCSQFGTVHEVHIQSIARSGEIGSYGFAFVIFSDIDSVEKACSVKRITTDYGSLHLKKKKAPAKYEIERTYVIHGCALNVSVHEIYNYFNTISAVELINRGGLGDMLYIVFKQECDNLLNDLHELGNSVLSLERAVPGTLVQRRDRCRKIKLHGVPTSFTEETLHTYFEQFGEVRDVYLGIRKKTGKRNNIAFIQFTNQVDAHSASKDFYHDIDGFSLKTVALGAVYE